MDRRRCLKGFLVVVALAMIGTGDLAGIVENGSTGATLRKWEGVTISVEGDETGWTAINYAVDEFSRQEIPIGGANYWKVLLGSEANILEKGMPDLPVISRSLIVPDDAKMAVRVVDGEYRVLSGVFVAPSKGNLYRDVNPADVPFEFGDVYERDAWYPEEIVELGDPYILRDYRGQVMRVSPFQYNPVRNELRVFSRLSIEAYPDGISTVNVPERRGPLAAIDSEFKRIYEKHFLNFGPNVAYYTPVEEQGNLLVITYDGFQTAMGEFVSWKNMKGVPTEMVPLSLVGNNESDIKDYIVDYYNSKGLTHVLLIGDIQQMPTFHFNFSGEQGASDPNYSYILGNDHYPDLFVGRFSAQTTSEVITMIRRSIEYERTPQAGAGWYHQGVGIGSNEGPGDDGEDDWEHMRNIRTDLMGYTYTAVDELYDGSHGGADASGNPTATMMSNSVNAGRSVINYCGHGWSGGWGTTGFSTGNVNGLANDNMLPFIWSVACNNGSFDDVGACFAEAWLRATRNGEPIGAVGAFMSSILQSWSPPMEGQDEMNAILTESYQNNIKRTYGGISFNGCMSMNDKYGGAGNEMTDTWHVFGDPSLEVRTDTPGNLTVVHGPMISIGSNGFEIEVPGVEGALCALSRDSQLLGSGQSNGAGRAIIHLEEPLAAAGDLDLVVTAYNMIPYETTIGVDASGTVLFMDDSYLGFGIQSGSWRSGSHPEAWNNGGWYIREGSGASSVAWRVDHVMTPGAYDVYTWKFKHSRMSLMATDAHYKVDHSLGESGWILVDQSVPGNEWVYLGTFEFDNGSLQGVELTDEANGVVIADMIKLVEAAPRR